jgi:hypothetical protein
MGFGPVDHIAQNGIQLGYGAMGEVRDNVIHDNFYTGCSHQDAAKTGCTPWVSGGLLMYDMVAKTVKSSKNMFSGNQFNVLLLTSQSLSPGPP